MNKKRVIFIVGLSHSGSTLLGSILGSNPNENFEVFHTGECYPYFNSKHHAFGNTESVRYKSDSIWKEIDPNTDKTNILTTIFKVTEATTIVDSGKNRAWLRRCIKECEIKGYDYQAVVSWRSPLNAIYSFWKRNLDLSRWQSEMNQLETTLQLFENYKLVDVGNLIAQPRIKTRHLCEQLKIDYFPGKQRYWEWQHAHLSGAKMQRQHIRNPETGKFRKSGGFKSNFDIDRARIFIKPNRDFIDKLISQKI